MHRLTARFLLLFALAGTFVPLALAATTASPHACCLRKAAHQCHGSGPESDQRIIHDVGCCNRNCCRAVTTLQSAHARSSAASSIAQSIEARIAESRHDAPASELFCSRSTRAPPQVSIA